MDELKQMIEKMNNEWTSFKSENDRRLKEVESKGRADPLTESKIDKHSSAIGEIQKSIDSMVAKMNRPGAAPADEANEAGRAHSKAFNAFIRKGKLDGLGELQEKAVSIGVDPDGGWAVPSGLDTQILAIETNEVPMRGLCNVMTVGNEKYEQLVNLHGAGSGWVGETEARIETTEPDLAKVAPNFGEIYANPASTQRALDDTFINVEAWLAQEIALAFALQENTSFLTGNGINKPKGILSYTMAETADATRTFGTIEKKKSGSSGDFDTDDIIDIIHLLKKPYRKGAAFLMATLTLAKIRKLKTATVNTYLWEPSVQLGVPSTLLGYGVEECEDMPAVAADSLSILFGNLKRAYTIYDVAGTRVLRDPFTHKPYVHFYTTKRVGGGLTDSLAVKVLALSA